MTPHQSFDLSFENTLYFVLYSGVPGKITSGRVELDASGSITIYDSYGCVIEYFSNGRLRSWSVTDRFQKPIPEWTHIVPEDRPKFPFSS